MSASNSSFNWRVMILALILPPLLLVALDLTLFGNVPSVAMPEINPRIANATLTAYTLCSLVLLGNLFFYGESRNRPLAPLVGMVAAVSLGVLATIFFIGQGSMLLENNGSVRAQAVYNVVHTLVSTGAIILAVLVAVGSTFSSITAQKNRSFFDDEQE
ncbi:MAG: hypothetical protein CMA63_04250 [Euryarchaeota archaeon]|nr:hypothetical protein [Euryarchaeota archaeon]|tara:strand:+ start:52638 stop:53114 length:477 start_codon:yes stop_codon:yes gene_type:complete